MRAPSREAAHAAAQQPYEYSFLNVQTVFRLIEDNRVQRVDDLVGHLLAAMRGQTVHKSRMRLGELHERGIHLVGSENRGTFRLFLFVSHARPGISINRIGSGNGFARVGQDAERSLGLICNGLRHGDDNGIEPVGLRSSDGNFRAYRGARQKQRVRHVVAIAHIGEMNLREIAEVLMEGEKVRERLAGMFEFAQRIDDRNAGVSRHLLDYSMTESAQHNDVDPAFEVVGDVVERLAGIETAGRLVDEKCAAAQAVHAGFEREAGAQRRLLEEHHHLLAGESAAEVRGPLLEHGGEVEEREYFGGSEIVDGDEIARRDRLRQHVRRARPCLCRWRVHQCHGIGPHLRFVPLLENSYDRSRIRRASACAFFLSVAMTSTVSSPARVPTTSGQREASSAAATGCALPTVVFTTSRFWAWRISTTNWCARCITDGKTPSALRLSPARRYPSGPLTSLSSWMSRERVAWPTS